MSVLEEARALNVGGAPQDPKAKLLPPTVSHPTSLAERHSLAKHLNPYLREKKNKVLGERKHF